VTRAEVTPLAHRRIRVLRWSVFLCCVWVAVAFRVSPARAQSGAELERARRVCITLVAPENELSSLRTALAEVTQSLPLSLQQVVLPELDVGAIVAPRAAEAGVLARIFIALHGQRAELYLVDEVGGRVLVREVPRSGVSAAVVHEQLAQIVLASLQTLMEGGVVGVRRQAVTLQPTEPPSATPLRRPSAPDFASRVSLSGGAYYGVVAYAPGLLLANGPGLLLGVHGSGRGAHWSLAGAAEYRAVAASDSFARVRLDVIPLRLLGGFGFSFGVSRWVAELGPGVDCVRVSTRAGASTERIASPRWRAMATIRLQSRLLVHASENVTLFGLASLDLDPSGTRYIVNIDGRDHGLLAPWSLRPGIGIGAGF